MLTLFCKIKEKHPQFPAKWGCFVVAAPAYDAASLLAAPISTNLYAVRRGRVQKNIIFAI
ncbi:hypothetical protein BBD42_06455 [Paenibacillus sp. BIHB 4019]|uniref:Uncharacterized protein n=1 Tax=Paenibacillus sp. BIHB 4019 TaxID=1870819 RepID=A0A1B2DEM8_9BACL|nr:hypothetical protein BBD42_06455 [Paenibacillus sp. BIHB 4019]